MGLNLNIKKAKLMTRIEQPTLELTMKVLMDRICPLRSTIHNKRTSNQEIVFRLALGRTAMEKMFVCHDVFVSLKMP